MFLKIAQCAFLTVWGAYLLTLGVVLFSAHPSRFTLYALAVLITLVVNLSEVWREHVSLSPRSPQPSGQQP